MDFDVKELGLSAEEIKRGLEKAVERGSLLKVQKEAVVYFLLTPRADRAAAEAIERESGIPQSAHVRAAAGTSEYVQVV